MSLTGRLQTVKCGQRGKRRSHLQTTSAFRHDRRSSGSLSLLLWFSLSIQLWRFCSVYSSGVIATVCGAWHNILCGTMQFSSWVISRPKHCRGFSSGVNGFFKVSDSLVCCEAVVKHFQWPFHDLLLFHWCTIQWGDNCSLANQIRGQRRAHQFTYESASQVAANGL